MTISLTSLLVPTYRQMLTALRGWLDKAEAQAGAADAPALLSARLAPDMFPLATQIRFACVQVVEAAHRLRGLAYPDTVDLLLNEGRGAGDQPGTFAEARARIDQTLALLDGLTPDALDAAGPIAHDLPNGMVFDLSAEQYARDWTLGQFYFHVMIAYAILRQQGIELGKADYVGHLLPFLRQ